MLLLPARIKWTSTDVDIRHEICWNTTDAWKTGKLGQKMNDVKYVNENTIHIFLK